MKHILVLGAGKSSPYLIHYLLENAEAGDWVVTVADLDLEMARDKVREHPRGKAIRFDADDDEQLDKMISDADLVVHMLTPAFQYRIARRCLDHGTDMVSVSYRDARTRALHEEALKKGVLILTEVGLDPGIDHMGALALISRMRGDGVEITGFRSYGSGIPAPDSITNPLNYVITWNPYNVTMAGKRGAQYLEKGQIKIIPGSRVFKTTWPVEVDDVGVLEAYPNRDSLSYLETFGLEGVNTMIRGTLRYPGWCETWQQLVNLGLPSDDLDIPNINDRTYREVLEMFLPLNVTPGYRLEKRLAYLLQISPTGQIMRNLNWLGVLSDEQVTCLGSSPAAMLTDLLQRKLPLHPNARDMVILLHELDVKYSDGEEKMIRSTMVAYGEPDGFTAMAKTVGMPAAISIKLILSGELKLKGCHIPTDSSIYSPVLRELDAAGIHFQETTAPVQDIVH